MPAPIPPGYTRGATLFFGPMQQDSVTTRLLQTFWDYAGAYGARLLILSSAEETAPIAERCAALFREWESDEVAILAVHSRQAAHGSSHQQAIEQATGILLLGENPVRLTTVLGGTRLAQAIRRANARGKVVAGWGGGGAVLCEHLIAFDSAQVRGNQPYLHRHLIQFAPGLGLTNRVVLDSMDGGANSWMQLARLLNAVAYNPFLIGIGVKADSGVVIYPDNTLEVYGDNNVIVVDASGMTYTNLHELSPEDPLSMLGVTLHVLAPGYTFNLVERCAHAPAPSDIPQTDEPKAAF